MSRTFKKTSKKKSLERKSKKLSSRSSKKSRKGASPKSGAKASKPPGKNKGEDLLEQVIRLTGIPRHAIRRELKTILDRKNLDVEQLTLDQLRLVVASYLREIMGGLLERAGHKRPDTQH